MSLRFKTNLLEHAKAVGVWARRRGARSCIDTTDLSLSIEFETQRHRLQPQFVGKRDGKTLCYFAAADRFAVGFVGWLPHALQAWDISLSKLAFKAAAREVQLATPAHWTSPADVDMPCLVKRTRGAFGYGMRGPFSASEAARLSLAEGEYCEAFTWGRIARAWYWTERLAVLEIFPMPALCADGVSTCEVLMRRASTELPPDLADFAPLLRLQGFELDDVPPAGARLTCDYRYVSPFNPTAYANHNVLPRLDNEAIVQRFAQAGARLWPRIPGPPGRQIGFVLDAIVDAQGQPWFLEVNSNPQLHPDVYEAMLDGLCGLAGGAADRPRQ